MCSHDTFCNLFRSSTFPHQCEVFYATAGNFSDQPARLRNMGLVVAHVLGYTDGLPHIL